MPYKGVIIYEDLLDPLDHHEVKFIVENLKVDGQP